MRKLERCRGQLPRNHLRGTGSTSRHRMRCAPLRWRSWARAYGAVAEVTQLIALRLAQEPRRDGHAAACSAVRCDASPAQQGRSHEALDLESPWFAFRFRQLKREIDGSRALALAVVGRTGAGPASSLNEARGLSHAIEPAVLIAAVDAICALKAHEPDVDRARGRVRGSCLSPWRAGSSCHRLSGVAGATAGSAACYSRSRPLDICDSHGA